MSRKRRRAPRVAAACAGERRPKRGRLAEDSPTCAAVRRIAVMMAEGRTDAADMWLGQLADIVDVLAARSPVLDALLRGVASGRLGRERG